MQNFGNGFARNVVIFRFDNISSSYTHNQKGEGINNSVVAAEKKLLLTLMQQIQNFL